MRVVDINGSRADLPDVDEVWAIDPRARRADPAVFDDIGNTPSSTPLGSRACMIAMPGSVEDLARRVALYRDAGAPAAVRICPGADGHGFPLEPWAVSPIPEFCDREGLALLVDFGGDTSWAYPWSDIVRFARLYPYLAVVALGAPLDGPVASRALDATSNLILETSAAVGEEGPRILSRVSDMHGARRLVYGSGAGGLAPREIIDQLPEADARVILAETADRLADASWAARHL